MVIPTLSGGSSRSLHHRHGSFQTGCNPVPASESTGHEPVQLLALSTASEELPGMSGILARRLPPGIIQLRPAAGTSRAYIGDPGLGIPQSPESGPGCLRGAIRVAGAQE
jgi:hypothetical protein